MVELRYDVIVVGGGAAGCLAALRLTEKRLRVLLVSKSLAGKGGASIFAGNLVLSGRLLGNTAEQAHSTAEFLVKYHNQYLIDQRWAERCGRWVESNYYAELERAGLYLRRDRNGSVVTSPGPIRSVAANVQGNSGVNLMDVRRKQLIRAGVARLEEVMVIDLLKRRDGSVGGVYAVSILSGERYVLQARAVVLATGYSDRLHRRSTGTREMTCDGLVMAWRAGAALQNLEMQWWHTNDLATPAVWQRVQIYPNPILGAPGSARMVTAAHEDFFDQQRDDPMAFGPYCLQLKALHKLVKKGAARYDGGYFSGFDNMPVSDVERYTSYAKAYHQLGMPGPHALLECGVTAHYRQGGVVVTDLTRMRTDVPGLYVAGGLGGHSNGLIALASFDGFNVAEGVADDFDRLASGAVDPASTRAVEMRLRDLAISGRRATGRYPSQIKEDLQAAMWDHCGVEKNERGLRTMLAIIDDLATNALPNMRVPEADGKCAYEFLGAIELGNMVEAARLVVLSSLQRQESRGPFFREDYPYTDNVEWLAANIIRRTSAGVSFERRPYKCERFSPGFERKLNSEVPW